MLYYTILYYTILYHTILYYTILYHTIPYYTILYHTIPYHTILYYTILYFTILYYTLLYYTILYYTILYYTILLLYYTILYHTNNKTTQAKRHGHRHGRPPSEIYFGLFLVVLQAQKGNIYFTELAERVEYGNYEKGMGIGMGGLPPLGGPPAPGSRTIVSMFTF